MTTTVRIARSFDAEGLGPEVAVSVPLAQRGTVMADWRAEDRLQPSEAAQAPAQRQQPWAAKAAQASEPGRDPQARSAAARSSDPASAPRSAPSAAVATPHPLAQPAARPTSAQAIGGRMGAPVVPLLLVFGLKVAATAVGLAGALQAAWIWLGAQP